MSNDTPKYFDDDGYRCQNDDPRCRRFVLVQDYEKLERELEQANRHKEWLRWILEKVTEYEPPRLRDLSRAFEVLKTIEEEESTT